MSFSGATDTPGEWAALFGLGGGVLDVHSLKLTSGATPSDLLSKGVSVWSGSLSTGGGSLSRGVSGGLGLCPGGLCLGVWGSLSSRVCPRGVSVHWWVTVDGVWVCQRTPPPKVKSRQYAS